MYDDEEVRQLCDFSLEELQDEADDLYDKYKISTIKEERKIIRNRYYDVTTEYNKRVNFEAYRTNL